MKKLFLFASATLALVATSCSDDFNPGNSSGPEGVSKVYATYPGFENLNKTRTHAEPLPTGGFVPAWDNGDAIGIYGVTNSFVQNSSYVYKTTEDNGQEVTQFVGQSYIAAGQDFFGYYPYNQAGLNDKGEITIYIPANQSFNYAMSGLDGTEPTYEPGSYSQNVRPAIAYGTSSTENEIQMQFQPVAAAMRFPVVGYGTIRQATLKITNSENSGGVNLNGSFSVNPQTIITGGAAAENVPAYLLEQAEGLEFTPSSNATTINLDCGSGIELSDTPVYLWFVVPADINLSGATISLTANNGEVNGTEDLERVIPTTTTASTSLTKVTTVGGTTPVSVDGTNVNCWNFTFGKAIIKTAAQFIEYAYVATNGVDEDLVSQYNNVENKAYTQLPDILTYTGTTLEAENVTGLKPALIVGNSNGILNVSPSALIAELEGNGAAGGIYGPIPYYMTIYGDYIDGSKSIPTIGPSSQSSSVKGYPFSIEGSGLTKEGAPATTLSGLVVKGNGMFQSSGTASSVSNLNIASGTVTSQSVTPNSNFGSYFLSSGNYMSYDNIVVDNTCTLNPVEDTMTALIGSVTNNATNYKLLLQITNNSNYALLNTLYANSSYNFNFTSFGNYTGTDVKYGVTQFNKVIVANTGNNAIFTIYDQKEAEMLIYDADRTSKLSTVDSYSVFSEPTTDEGYATSYWTGYASDVVAGSAEALAYVVQNGTGTFEMSMDLNLMGYSVDTTNTEPLSYWWAKSGGDANPTITGAAKGEDNYTISNVYVNGYKGAITETTPNPGTTNNITIFGFKPNISGVTLSGVNINNSRSGDYGIYVGVISALPGTMENVVVNGMNVTNTAATVGNSSYNAFGGMFTALTGPLSGCELQGNVTFKNNVTGSSAPAYGYVAGYYKFTTSTKSTQNTIQNPIVANSNYTLNPTTTPPFGQFDLVINKVANANSAIQIYLLGFDTDIAKDGNMSLTGDGYAPQVQVFYQNYMQEYNYDDDTTEYVKGKLWTLDENVNDGDLN